MSNLFAYGLGIAVGLVIGSIIWAFAWIRHGKESAIAGAYDSAIVASLRSSLRPNSGKPLLAGRPASARFIGMRQSDPGGVFVEPHA